MQIFIHRLKIILCAINDPAGHGCPADLHFQMFEVFFLTVQRHGHDGFKIHYMCRKTGRYVTSGNQCSFSFILDELRFFCFFAFRAFIGGRIIINAFQLWFCITQFCPDEFMTDGNHSGSADSACFLLFGQRIDIDVLVGRSAKISS